MKETDYEVDEEKKERKKDRDDIHENALDDEEQWVKQESVGKEGVMKKWTHESLKNDERRKERKEKQTNELDREKEGSKALKTKQKRNQDSKGEGVMKQAWRKQVRKREERNNMKNRD